MDRASRMGYQSRKTQIPLIDLFAGPGGLCEGFCNDYDRTTRLRFRSALSIEKEPFAHATLKLRSFYRQFQSKRVPHEYYEYLRGEISREDLFLGFPKEAAAANAIAWKAELGGEEVPDTEVDQRIEKSLKKNKTWVLVGGPPCQAYSLVGRSRMRTRSPESFEKDPRHFLYKEYLRILAVHKPPVFVLENVKGLLSSKVNGQNTFDMILKDLQSPTGALGSARQSRVLKNQSYSVYPVADYTEDLFGGSPEDYVVRCEHHGIPQARHRVIILGIRNDLGVKPKTLPFSSKMIPSWRAIGLLPKLRSDITGKEKNWIDALKAVSQSVRKSKLNVDQEVQRKMIESVSMMTLGMTQGGPFVKSKVSSRYMAEWFADERIGGVCNHKSRSHMESDLHRYLFASCFAAVHDRSPVLRDFPIELLPQHKNVVRALSSGSGLFSDRFRVQTKKQPSTTITSHIAKDGHYYIHPDPVQCRSLTVREAARLQTFPDNYFFEGPQTAQYHQVGNAVPPLLAHSISEIVADVLARSRLVKRG